MDFIALHYCGLLTAGCRSYLVAVYLFMKLELAGIKIDLIIILFLGQLLR